MRKDYIWKDGMWMYVRSIYKRLNNRIRFIKDNGDVYYYLNGNAHGRNKMPKCWQYYWMGRRLR